MNQSGSLYVMSVRFSRSTSRLDADYMPLVASTARWSWIPSLGLFSCSLLPVVGECDEACRADVSREDLDAGDYRFLIGDNHLRRG